MHRPGLTFPKTSSIRLSSWQVLRGQKKILLIGSQIMHFPQNFNKRQKKLGEQEHMLVCNLFSLLIDLFFRIRFTNDCWWKSLFQGLHCLSLKTAV